MNDPMTFVMWDIYDFDLTLKGHGKLNILCFWTDRIVGRHDETPHVGAPPAHRNSYSNNNNDLLFIYDFNST